MLISHKNEVQVLTKGQSIPLGTKKSVQSVVCLLDHVLRGVYKPPVGYSWLKVGGIGHLDGIYGHI
jgi:hypothetical protein